MEDSRSTFLFILAHVRIVISVEIYPLPQFTGFDLYQFCKYVHTINYYRCGVSDLSIQQHLCIKLIEKQEQYTMMCGFGDNIGTFCLYERHCSSVLEHGWATIFRHATANRYRNSTSNILSKNTYFFFIHCASVCTHLVNVSFILFGEQMHIMIRNFTESTTKTCCGLSQIQNAKYRNFC